jgi:hypothetical protein
MLKRALRTAVRTARTWMAEPESPPREDKWVESLYIAHILGHPLYGRRSSNPTPEADRRLVGLDD